ncbi:hypothetical protein ACFRAE_02670 [Sphingobacterium sp. HJSM2_6]|uniref:hypothetical protein n=1 Tax=Sphingobacterium sp. HJSM2_6 TaxID=3366264 RepID=UPI003BBEF4E2
MQFKKIFCSLLITLLSIIFLTSVIYSLLIVNKEANWSLLFKGLFPLCLAAVVIALTYRSILPNWNINLTISSYLNLKFIVLITVIPILNTILFQPIARSLHYNLAKVATLNSVQELKAFEKPAFLEVEDWYVDRMQVIPINTIKPLSAITFGKVEQKVLLLVPIFNRDDAYKSNAKAWLAFVYQKTLTAEEAKPANYVEFLNSSITHFKRMNIADFSYLEAYPRGENYDILYEMAKVHTFYKSGFDNIYKGQYVDRDTLAIYYLKYSLFFFLIVGLLAILLISLLLHYVANKQPNQELPV